MSLIVANKIYVMTPNGEREIQLCLGDISKLAKEDSVDVIMISAFPGDYSETPSSVIGALSRELGLSVRKLAYGRKKEDLRRQFHCWISKPLPAWIPYRQLLCFERHIQTCFENVSTLDAVKDVFRAMMPIFNNHNKSVITPLLATGDQRESRSQMLKVMVNTAYQWMMIGLPLQKLKIVVYARQLSQLGPTEQKCVQIFSEMKDIINNMKSVPRQKVRNSKVVHDFFLVFHSDDVKLANVVREKLAGADKAVSVMTVADLESKPDNWQHAVFTAMLVCARVVPLLTESFLSDASCIDQYNIALCCNRQLHRRLLAPLYLEQLSALPVYMTMVQWSNCKPRDPTKIDMTCKTLVSQVRSGAGISDLQYDVFISYCHKDMAHAKVFVETFKQLNPKLKVFFDTEELKTGVSWQQTLYEALDRTHCMLALLSPAYLSSPVCNEELNLSMARHMSKNKELQLVLVCIEEISDIPAFDVVKPVKRDGKEMSNLADEVCQGITNWLDTEEVDNNITTVPEEPVEFDDLASQKRANIFNQMYSTSDGRIQLVGKKNEITAQAEVSENSSCDLFLSYVLSDEKYVTFILEILNSWSCKPKINSKFGSSTDSLSLITEAKCMVVFMSSNYLQSPKEMEELNMILSHKRSKPLKPLYVVQLENLPNKPTYVHLISCHTALLDEMWEEKKEELLPKLDMSQVKKIQDKMQKKFEAIDEMNIGPLVKISCDLQYINNGGCLADQPLQNTPAVLQNIMSLYVDPTRSEMSAEEAWAYINKDLDEASQQHSEIDTSETGKDAVMAESVESYVAKVINVAAHDVEQDNNSQDDEKICDKTEEVINVAAPDVQQQSNSKDDEKTSDTTDEVINVAADDVKQESNSQDDEKTSDNTEVNTESNSQPVEKTKDDTDESESREYGPAGNGDGSTVAEPSIQSNPLNENVTERPSEKPDQKTCSKSDKNTVVTNTKRSSRSCNLM